MPASLDSLVQRRDQLRAAAQQVAGKPAPEFELAADVECLPPKRGLETYPYFLSHSAAA